MRTRPWELTDQLWERFAPLIPARPGRDPNREYQRKPGGGRHVADPRKTLEGILYVLRTGCQWNAVPRCYGGAQPSTAISSSGRVPAFSKPPGRRA